MKGSVGLQDCYYFSGKEALALKLNLHFKELIRLGSSSGTNFNVKPSNSRFVVEDCLVNLQRIRKKTCQRFLGLLLIRNLLKRLQSFELLQREQTNDDLLFYALIQAYFNLLHWEEKKGFKLAKFALKLTCYSQPRSVFKCID